MPARRGGSGPQALPSTSIPTSKRRSATRWVAGEERTEASRPRGPVRAWYLLSQGALTGSTSERWGSPRSTSRFQSPTPAAIRAPGKRRRSASKRGVATRRSPTSLLRSTKIELGSAGGSLWVGEKAAAVRTAPSNVAPAIRFPIRRATRRSGLSGFSGSKDLLLPGPGDRGPGEPLVVAVRLQVFEGTGRDLGGRRERAERGRKVGPQVGHRSGLRREHGEPRLQHLGQAQPPPLDAAGEETGVVPSEERRELPPGEGGKDPHAAGAQRLGGQVPLGGRATAGDRERVVRARGEALRKEPEQPAGPLLGAPAADPEEAGPWPGGSAPAPPDLGQGFPLGRRQGAEIDPQLGSPEGEAAGHPIELVGAQPDDAARPPPSIHR